MNAFRLPNGKLDQQYLRICAVYRMLRQNRINTNQAVCLLRARNVNNPAGLVRIWCENFRSNRIAIRLTDDFKEFA